MEVGEALTSHVRDHIENQVKKYFDTAISADVHFSKHNSHFHVNLLVNEGVKKGIVIQSSGEADDAYGAFNEAMERGSSQLRKYKEKMKEARKEGGIKDHNF